MELSRRDATAALATLGAVGGAGWAARRWRSDGEGAPGADAESAANAGSDDELPDDRVREAMVAVAEVVYPDAVSGVPTFVEAFLEGRLADPERAAGLRAAVADLEASADAWYGSRVAALSPDERDRLLREVGADTADEDPAGTVAERVRYYVVNDLLLALFSSPTGGELVGIENPQGHPGGTDGYRRGPR